MNPFARTSQKTAGIALVAGAAVAVVSLWAVARTPANTGGPLEDFTSIEASRIPFEIKEYAKLADLVIIGTPVAESVHPFTDNTGIPETAKTDEMYATAGYFDVTVEVSEYLKGEGPEEISVRRLAPPPDVLLDSSAPEPQLNQTYVFFLETGTDLWIGGYIALGQESLGVLAAGAVEFPDRKLTVKKFREEVKSAEKDEG